MPSLKCGLRGSRTRELHNSCKSDIFAFYPEESGETGVANLPRDLLSTIFLCIAIALPRIGRFMRSVDRELSGLIGFAGRIKLSKFAWTCVDSYCEMLNLLIGIVVASTISPYSDG